MRRFLVFVSIIGLFSFNTHAADMRANDTFDPLFMVSEKAFLSETDLNYVDKIMRLGQQFSYGVNDRFSLALNGHYQIGFDHRGTGFSAFDFGGKYRMGVASSNDAGMVYDVLFGLKFGGASDVRTPDYAKSTYYAGVRLGKQWAGWTFSGTVKSSWVFDDTRGVSYLNFIPEVYFRYDLNWRVGFGFDFVKSTNQQLFADQEWLNFKLVRQFGNTQYGAKVGYEFEDSNIQIGAQVNILF